ncbi:MAG: GNAT family N-acetyltransferase [Clostridia bacterium]|nr:GNAT family N-acetyltransferase [Clostridia bacterium]
MLVIRPVHPDDVRPLWETMVTERAVWGTLALPSSRLDRARRFVEAEPERTRRFVAELDGRVVGSIGLTLGAGRRRHSGVIGMAVHDDFQGRGVGTALMAACVDLADRWLALERLELEVFPDNEPALRLYRRFGFQEEGRLRATVLRDGRRVDLLAMARLRGRALESPEAPARDESVRPAPPGPPPGDLRLRAVLPEDAEALHALRLQPAVQRALELTPDLPPSETRRWLEQLGSDEHVLVAESGGKPVGYGQLKVFGGRLAHVGRITALAVDAGFRGRGLGRRLAAALLALGERWLGLARIESEVPADDLCVQRLLGSLGFEREAVKRAALITDGRFAATEVWARIGCSDAPDAD